MHRYVRPSTTGIALLLSAVLLAGCGGETPSPAGANPAGDLQPIAGSAEDNPEASSSASGATAKYRLGEDLPEAASVLDLRAMDPGDSVVVVGRVKDFTRGLAAFKIVDEEVDYCGVGEDTMESCPTPWDYCCTPKEVLTQATLGVELHDAEGNVVEAAFSELGLRELDLIAIRGTLEKTDAGALYLVTTEGWYLRERPDLGDKKIAWPRR